MGLKSGSVTAVDRVSALASSLCFATLVTSFTFKGLIVFIKTEARVLFDPSISGITLFLGSSSGLIFSLVGRLVMAICLSVGVLAASNRDNLGAACYSVLKQW